MGEGRGLGGGGRGHFSPAAIYCTPTRCLALKGLRTMNFKTRTRNFVHCVFLRCDASRRTHTQKAMMCARRQTTALQREHSVKQFGFRSRNAWRTSCSTGLLLTTGFLGVFMAYRNRGERSMTEQRLPSLGTAGRVPSDGA